MKINKKLWQCKLGKLYSLNHFIPVLHFIRNQFHWIISNQRTGSCMKFNIGMKWLQCSPKQNFVQKHHDIGYRNCSTISGCFCCKLSKLKSFPCDAEAAPLRVTLVRRASNIILRKSSEKTKNIRSYK